MAEYALGLRVAVSGAGGQTGGHVFRKLLALPDVDAVGWTRSAASKEALLESVGKDAEVCVVDVTDAASCEEATVGIDALVVCTSAKPAPTGETSAEGKPVMGFPDGMPEAVDWLGQKNQIDACKARGAHVVICSSMGGTDPANMLNALGRCAYLRASLGLA